MMHGQKNIMSINKRFTILNFFRPLLKNMFVSCHLQSEGGSLCCLVGVFFSVFDQWVLLAAMEDKIQNCKISVNWFIL